MNKQKLRKIIYSLIFLLICSVTIYFQLLQNTISQLIGNGLSPNVIYLALTVPLITLIVSITRTLIGISISTIYIPIILVITGLAIGLDLTIIFLLFSLAIAILVKAAIADFHFHFASKISIILSFVALSIIVSLPLIEKIIPHSIVGQNQSLIIYALLIISVINEKFFNFKITKNNLFNDLKQVLKTLLFSIFCFFLLGGPIILGPIIIQWVWLKDLIFAYPDLIFISLILNIIIGQYTGLRLDEFIRFRKLIFKNK